MFCCLVAVSWIKGWSYAVSFGLQACNSNEQYPPQGNKLFNNSNVATTIMKKVITFYTKL